MQTPNYVLRANEGILFPDETKSMLRFFKKAVWIIIGFIILGSLFFQDNLFSELSWSARVLLIAMAIGLSFKSTDKRVASPFEIWFYDDYFIVYREKRYYDKKVTRKEYNKFFYKDIHKFQYRTGVKRINIIGDVEAIWYNYNKNGSLPEKPTYHRKVNGGICYFYTTHSPEVDFISEIERHSPMKVEIVD